MEILGSHPGFIVARGSTAGEIRNNFNICRDDKGIFIQMFSHCGNSFYFDIEDLEKVVSIKTKGGNQATWYNAKTGTTSDGKRDLIYVCCRYDSKTIYLHSYLMNHLDKGKGTTSIDHIDQNPLNNRRYNLRIATQSEQNKNTVKRSRKRTAKKLPEGINQEDLPKYVVYYSEKIKSQPGYRDYFRIEKHPLQKMGLQKDKWATTKSMSKTPQFKLNQAIEKLQIFDDWYGLVNINL